MRKLITFLLVLAVLGSAGYFIYRWQMQQRASAATNFQTVLAERGELIATIGATGRVRSNQTALLYWKISGASDQVYIEVGDQVKRAKLADLQQSSLPQNVILAQATWSAPRKRWTICTPRQKMPASRRCNRLRTMPRQSRAPIPADTSRRPWIRLTWRRWRLSVDQEKISAVSAAFEPYKYYPSGDATPGFEGSPG
jgi:multidrug efflux pump subunit AcrA (membrane-fusion protein)